MKAAPEEIRGIKCMWHVETDFFALAVFMIMLLKEHSLKKEKRDVPRRVFYYVLVFSILYDCIDIVSSTAQNIFTSWWAYQLSMTIYVASMPLLAAVWVAYAFVLIHKDYPLKKLYRYITYIMIPYALYVILALSNPFTGLFFHLAADMEYSRGIFFLPAGVGSMMFYSAVGLLIVLWNLTGKMKNWK